MTASKLLTKFLLYFEVLTPDNASQEISLKEFVNDDLSFQICSARLFLKIF